MSSFRAETRSCSPARAGTQQELRTELDLTRGRVRSGSRGDVVYVCVCQEEEVLRLLKKRHPLKLLLNVSFLMTQFGQRDRTARTIYVRVP